MHARGGLPRQSLRGVQGNLLKRLNGRPAQEQASRPLMTAFTIVALPNWAIVLTSSETAWMSTGSNTRTEV